MRAAMPSFDARARSSRRESIPILYSSRAGVIDADEYVLTDSDDSRAVHRRRDRRHPGMADRESGGPPSTGLRAGVQHEPLFRAEVADARTLPRRPSRRGERRPGPFERILLWRGQ